MRSLALLVFASSASLWAAEPNYPTLVRTGADGRLVYRAYNETGDTVLDFSHCGYGGGGVALPNAPVKIRVQPKANGDDTARVQAALDELARLPLGPDGLRGAVLLTRGTYRIAGTLKMTASGVVLRGEGQNEDGTVLEATGKTQRNLIEVGVGRPPKRRAEANVRIVDAYVPVGARSFRVANAGALRVGQGLVVERHGNAAWISALGMDRIKGRPGRETETKQWTPFTLSFDRVITALEGDRVTVDAPIACAIDERWGGGVVVPLTEDARPERIGVENLRAVSEFDPSVTLVHGQDLRYAADERHATHLVQFAHVKNAWARDVTAVHFYHGVALIDNGAKWITVQDSTSLAPVSKIDGGRRYPFHISGGQLSLVLRCRSEGARHAFVVGARVAGPNAFVDGVSRNEFATSEPHHRWSVGGLYDNIESDIAFQDRQWMGTGHGWAGANYVAWNTRGTLICQQPPTAQNFSFGHVGRRERGAFDRPAGHWESEGKPVAPKSLYFAQLADRLGSEASDRLKK